MIEPPLAKLEIETRRAWLAIDWLVRDHTAAWVALAGLDEHAAALRALAPIVGSASARASKEMMSPARAAWDAGRAAAWDDAKRANRAAAWDEEWEDALCWACRAAGYSARDAAYYATWYVKTSVTVQPFGSPPEAPIGLR
jgi:hypothetical protein